MQDSAAGLDGGNAGQGAGQDAGATRVNGLMSTLGKRTSERDEAIAERDRLREQLAREMAGDPEPDEQPAPPAPATAAADDDGATTQDDGPTEIEPADLQPDQDGYARTSDGGVFRPGSLPTTGLAPTAPARAPLPKAPEPGTLAELRSRFATELPGYVAEIAENSLLGQR